MDGDSAIIADDEGQLTPLHPNYIKVVRLGTVLTLQYTTEPSTP